MEKIIIILLAFTLTGISCFSQDGIYYKAEYLKSKYNSITKKITVDDNVYDAVKDLYSGDKDQVIAELNGNPFLKNMFLKQAGASGNAFSFNLSSIGGLNVTKFANAIADVMIERAKEELTVAFFDRFKKFATDNPEFEILFPKTTSNLENLLSYKYPEMLPSLQTSFLEDIRMITFRLDDVLELPRYKKLFEKLPEVAVAIRSLRLMQELETGASNAADIINEFASFPEWSNTEKIKPIGSAIKLTAFFSESIRNINKDSIWVSPKGLKKLFYDETLFTIYMGLLYQKALNDTKLVLYYYDQNGVSTSKRFSDLLSEQKPNLLTFQRKLKEFFDLTSKVNVSYKDLKNKQEQQQSISNDDYYNYINTSLDVVEYGFSLAELFEKDIQKQEEYISLLRKSNDLYRNIYTKEYNQAMVNVIDIFTKIQKLAKDKNTKITPIDASSLISKKTGEITLNESLVLIKKDESYQIVKKDQKDKPLETLETLDRFISGDDLIFISSTEKLKHPLDKLLSFVESVKPYALFIANIVEAKSEEEIKSALENAILPVGSSSIKKHASFNLSIQSYLGARLNTAHNNTKSAWTNSWGVIAPIGFALSVGTNGGYNNPSSLSLFASLLDVGAIVDYKLTVDNTTVKQDYEIKLGQIFAPGGYIVYGLPWNLPLSFGMGGQYGPGLFKSNNGIEPISPGWRWNAFLAVDIPFFNISNRVRNKTK